MTTTERDVTGLGEARLRPEESEANPFNIFYKQLPDNIITDCEEILFPTFNSLDASSETSKKKNQFYLIKSCLTFFVFIFQLPFKSLPFQKSL